MSQKKIDLIAQLLAKAEQTTPEEAEALTEHAERLMVKYAIDQAVINERRARSGKESEKIVEERFEFTGAYRGEMLHMGASIIYGLGTLRGLQNTIANKGKTFSVYFIGFESDVEQAKVLFQSLQLQSMVAVREWWKLHKDEYAGQSSYQTEKARRSFVHGFGTGAGARIFASRAVIVEEASSGTELVLVNRKARVDHYADMRTNKTARGRKATGQDVAAGHGYLAGRNANTGDKAVGNTKAVEA